MFHGQDFFQPSSSAAVQLEAALVLLDLCQLAVTEIQIC